MTEDPYLDPALSILRNLVGATDEEALDHAEAELVGLRAAALEATILPGAYDLRHLQAFHHVLFQDIYDWAGELRTVEISKNALFCPVVNLRSYAAEIFGALHDDDLLVGLSKTQFVERFAHYFADVNALHPFREGNGRTQKSFFRQLSLAAGWYVAWERVAPDAHREAVAFSMTGDNSKLIALVDSIVEPA